MGSSKPQNSNQKIFITSLILISLSLLILVFSFKPFLPFLLVDSRVLQQPVIDIHRESHVTPLKITTTSSTTAKSINPRWFDIVEKDIGDKKVRVGLVNFSDDKEREEYTPRGPSIVENVNISFDRVSGDLRWEDLYPEWIDEEQKRHTPKCPEIPLPAAEGFRNLDVVVVKMPCEGWSEKRGLRDVFRLQVNLAAAKVAVESAWVGREVNRTVHVVFIGGCGPMQEIFRCDDRVRKVGEVSVYRPEMRRLKQKVLMPVGSCQIAPPFAETGREAWRPKDSSPPSQESPSTDATTSLHHQGQRQAYVTVLHSSEDYVCGAIALAQSIRQSKSTRDLILLHDDSLSPKSRVGLRIAGWKLRKTERIRSPFSRKGSYNEWNYSKLRIWQLTDYDKVIYIDADFIVIKNLDYLFYYPQLSASANNKVLFNSGLMVLEPSNCMFEDLMLKSFKVESYNGGDQGFLNEVFAWWHRLPKKVNHLKLSLEHEIKDDDIYAVHYLGLKPWTCYRDYDCNWDMEERHAFASDSMHEKWWPVYDRMPKELQMYCALSPKMNARIKKWRKIARNANLPDKHWEIEASDPRKNNLLVE